MMARIVALTLMMSWLSIASAQTTRSAPTATTQPALATPAPIASPATRLVNRSAEDMLRQMLQPQAQAAQPLQPLPDLPNPNAIDQTSGDNAVAPGATTQPLTAEGTILLDRIGRLTPGADGKTFEFTLESDGVVLADPPLVLAPNKRLEQLEQRVQNSYGDIKLRVSGEIMEYKGRNYLLLSRWAVLPDSVRPLQ
jgi:hypothetical protein